MQERSLGRLVPFPYLLKKMYYMLRVKVGKRIGQLTVPFNRNVEPETLVK